MEARVAVEQVFGKIRAMGTSRTAVVLQAYRYALDPTPRQRRALFSHAGASRLPTTGLWSTCDDAWRRLADASLGELRRQLAYKSAWAGTSLIEADRFFPSSKLCSRCGHVKAKLPLSEREYRCEHCGIVLDRDLNAARNLAALVASTSNGVAGSGPETKNARGWGQGPPFGGTVLDEAGSRHQVMDLGETGTVDWQRPAT